MPRKARNDRLDTRTARLKLRPRREPYWFTLQEGRAIGYRRAAGGRAGTWLARHYSAEEGRKYASLATADDTLDADGGCTLTFGQAQGRAAEWFREIERGAGRAVAPITVREAMDAYLDDYRARGGKAEHDLKATIAAHILPELGDKKVATLTNATVRGWHQRLAAAPARLRTAAKAQKKNTREAKTVDETRARRSTANRILTVLRAALTFAFRDGRVPSDDAWRRVKPFGNVEAPRIRYLTDAEVVRLVSACRPDVRALVTAAVLTGCRYGELGRLRAADLDHDTEVLHIRQAKAGKPRTVPLTAEAARFFSTLTAGKAGTALLLTRADGDAWGESHQHRPLQEACEAAGIVPAVSLHILRHTFASRLAQRAVPMGVIAAALGNTEAICAKHYAHLSPGYVADTIRQAAQEFGIVPTQPAVWRMRRPGP